MDPHHHDGPDLAAYLDRIGHEGPVAADLPTLRALQRAHIMAVPFDTIDPVRGVVPSLELPDLEDKLIRGGRGGYCFEHNSLFAAVLETIGFTVRRVSARVVLGADEHTSRPRTHMALLVGVPGEPLPFLADVGFGAAGASLAPLPLTEGTERTAGGRRHRLLRTAPATDGLALGDGPAGWVFQSHGPDGWADQYALSTEPTPRIDYVLANWYVATHPKSPFRQRVVAQRTDPDLHRQLVGRELFLTHADGTVERRTLADDDEVRKVLVTEFGLTLPDDTVITA